MSIDFDLSVQIAGARLSRRILGSPPLRLVLIIIIQVYYPLQGDASGQLAAPNARDRRRPSTTVYTCNSRITSLTYLYSALSVGETSPGLAAVPDDGEGGSDADWKKWIMQPGAAGFASVGHPVGTAAMMRRSLGGTSLLTLARPGCADHDNSRSG